MIIKTGLPAFLMQLSTSLLNIVINGTLGIYGGDLAISTVGIITSVQTLMLMPLTGMTQGQQPIISYNYWSKHFIMSWFSNHSIIPFNDYIYF